MSLQEIESAVAQLSTDDVTSGKLGRFAEEALEDVRKGRSKEL